MLTKDSSLSLDSWVQSEHEVPSQGGRKDGAGPFSGGRKDGARADISTSGYDGSQGWIKLNHGTVLMDPPHT